MNSPDHVSSSNAEIGMPALVAVAFAREQGYLVTALSQNVGEPGHECRDPSRHGRGIRCEEGDPSHPRPPMYHNDSPAVSKILYEPACTLAMKAEGYVRP